MSLLVSTLLLFLAAPPGVGKPAAVTLCFRGLSPATPLYSATASRNYRKLDEDTFMLDLDVAFNDGIAPVKLSKAPGTDCLKAWLPAQPVTKISAAFGRTDLNLGAEPKKVNLKLKPNLWYDGGDVAVQVQPFAKVTATRPGTITLTRRPPMAPEVDAKVGDVQNVPAGDYALDFAPPASAEVACDLEITADARGTVTPQRHAEVLAQVLENYRHEFAPSVLAAHKVHCHKGEQVSMKVSLFDGVVAYPLAPAIRLVTKPGAEPRFRLVRSGTSEPFKLGSTVHLGFGEAVALEVLEDSGPDPSARASVTPP